MAGGQEPHRRREDLAVAQVVPQRRAGRVDLLQLVQQQALDAVQHGLHKRRVLLHGLHVPVPAQQMLEVQDCAPHLAFYSTVPTTCLMFVNVSA